MSLMIAPSVLSADFLHLKDDLEMVNRSQADWFHLDVMDGVFVPNISFGFPVMEAMARQATKPLDVHLMIVEPWKFIDRVASLGAYLMTVHAEVCPDLPSVIKQIQAQGMKAGVSINPQTPLSLIEDVLDQVDLILVMSVHPGFGGQSFIESSIDKIRTLKQMLIQKEADALIEVDGGVNLETGKRLKEAGADILVAGSFVFKAEDPPEVIRQLKSL